LKKQVADDIRKAKSYWEVLKWFSTIIHASL
jgi:hypothetical protein